jgi:hypothetical protein
MAELDASPFPDDIKGEPVARPHRRRTSKLTISLAAGVVLVVGVLIGIQAEKAMGGGAGAGGAAVAGGAGRAGFGQQFGNRQPGAQASGQPNAQTSGQPNAQASGRPGGFGQRQGGFGGAGGATMGTVQKVEGGKVYLKAMDGSTVTINTNNSTTVQIAKPGKVSDLKTGTSVVVRGQRADDGSVAAVSISQGNQGGGGR